MSFYSAIYSIPYVLFAAILGFFSLSQKYSNSKTTKNNIFVILLIFIGLRGFIGTDFLNYYQLYERIPDLSGIIQYLKNESAYEFGFYIYSSFLKTIFSNYHVWVFVNSLIDLLILYWFFDKYSKSFFLSLLLFFVVNGLQIEIDLFRNAKAIYIFLLAIPAIQSRDFLRFNIIMAICISFHFSAFVLYPLYFISNNKFPSILIIGLFILVNIIYLFGLFPTSYLIGSIFKGSDSAAIIKLNKYIDQMGEGYGLTYGYLEKSIIFLWCLKNYNNNFSKNSVNLFFCNSYFIYYCIWYTFADVTVFVQRFPLLFVFSYWIIVPNMISISDHKKLIKWLVVVFCLLKTQLQFARDIYKYDNIITGIESYQSRASRLYDNLIDYY